MVISLHPPVLRRASLLAMLGFLFVLQGCCDPRIVTDELPDGCVGTKYLFALHGECSYDRWSVTGGVLPPGISLTSRGVLVGTPTLAGTYVFVVTLDDIEPVSKGFSMMVFEEDAPECVEEVSDLFDFP